MTFSIHFERLLEIKDSSFSETYLSGVICLGEFREEFASSLSYWIRDDYENQWREGIERILSGDLDASAIVVDIMSPYKTDSTLSWWLMYVEGEFVCFQEHILDFGRLPKGFQRRNLYSYIPSRHETKSDCSELAPSEWVLEKRELEEWIVRER